MGREERERGRREGDSGGRDNSSADANAHSPNGCKWPGMCHDKIR